MKILLASTGNPNERRSTVTEKTVKSKPITAIGKSMFLGIINGKFMKEILIKIKKS